MMMMMTEEWLDDVEEDGRKGNEERLAVYNLVFVDSMFGQHLGDRQKALDFGHVIEHSRDQ